jgi:hypothetical protein
MNTRVGTKLVLEHNILYQLLSDPLFWESVPEFLSLKDEGEKAHFFALEHLMTPREVSPGCVGCTSLKATMGPILVTMAEMVVEWSSNSPEKLENLVTYITKRRGYRPDPIVMYHKDNSGQIHAAEF